MGRVFLWKARFPQVGHTPSTMMLSNQVTVLECAYVMGLTELLKLRLAVVPGRSGKVAAIQY